ncbi:MAG: tRNA (adenosine(37)-N6)-threonylcarbamoyltransferase complex ATPase subunit type 1 TsaE [Gammaproteobacteria bacterium]|nr:tRNA (adenosine(37)-N6)-threonylcarbamoyltransferase complex ATPase subunit type 1 TsaE [Gammaproteobacteria bacterium]
MIKNSLTINLPAEAQTLELGAKLAVHSGSNTTIFLLGNLGAGKTTLSRGFLQGLGHTGKVKSPTYTLVEPYEIGDQKIFHFDLYRIHDPQELEFMGIQDYFVPPVLCLIEWPEHGAGFLPSPDVSCYIETQSTGRLARLTAHTVQGAAILATLSSEYSDDDKK